jgi:phage recombination protein Bet
MSTELVLTNEHVSLLQQTVCKGAGVPETMFFIEFCKRKGLDPFTRQIYWTPAGIIIGIDGLRAIADESGCYAPGNTVFTDDNGDMVASTTIMKKVGDEWFSVTESAYYSEYKNDKNPLWKTKKRVMLSKVSEARALRRAFPAKVGQLYIREEMPSMKEMQTTEANSKIRDAFKSLGVSEERIQIVLPLISEDEARKIYMEVKKFTGDQIKEFDRITESIIKDVYEVAAIDPTQETLKGYMKLQGASECPDFPEDD